jgi:hypothetical protein
MPDVIADCLQWKLSVDQALDAGMAKGVRSGLGYLDARLVKLEGNTG